jgi:hypothetical protein
VKASAETDALGPGNIRECLWVQFVDYSRSRLNHQSAITGVAGEPDDSPEWLTPSHIVHAG